MRRYPLKRHLAEVLELNRSIREAFEKNDLPAVKEGIERYSAIVKDANLVSFQSNYFFLIGNLEEAQRVLKEGLSKFPLHFDLNLNLGIIYEVQSDLSESLFQYIRAMKYASDDKRDLAEGYVNRMIELLEQTYQGQNEILAPIIEKAKGIISETDQRNFPLDINGKSEIRMSQMIGTREEYMTNLYKPPLGDLLHDVNGATRYLVGSETLKGKLASVEQTISLEAESLVPISLIEQNTDIEFEMNHKNYLFSGKDLAFERFHYLRFNESGTLNIRMNNPVFVGKPIPLKDPPLKKRLVFNIFVDGISHTFLQKHGLKSVMPNTYAYFQKGMTVSNCYATSEWTFPSVASMSTGNYTTNHGLFHPEFKQSIFVEGSLLLQEHFKKAGYFTAQIGGDWRVTPSHGYYKGFDRIIYKNFAGGFETPSIVTEAIEHLETFKEKNNYMWISLADVHHVPDEIEMNLSTQAQTNIEERVNRRKKGATTVLTSYDTNKHNKYLLEIKRIDFYLQTLYSYIENNYKDDEVLIVLLSDHGQSFLDDTRFLLNETRSKVPFMIRGGGVPVGESEEYMELVDLMPTLLHYSDLPAEEKIDGQLPKVFGGDKERKFTYTEAIHPNQTYKVLITDDEHTLCFENGSPILNDGLVDLGDYTVQLINKETGCDESDEFPEKVNEYEDIIWNHIKRHIKLV